MKKPHKHAELIKAWADGAGIEMKTIKGEWVEAMPSWEDTIEYRIKPERKPDHVFKIKCDDLDGYVPNIKWVSDIEQHDMILIWDGETRKFKSAEVLK